MPSKFHHWCQQWLITADEAMTRTRRMLGTPSRTSGSAAPVKSPVKSLQLNDLEPRLLFSATPIDPSLLSGGSSEVSEQTLVIEVSHEDSSSESTTLDSLAQSSPTQSTASGVVFIDSSVPDIEQLLDDIATSDRDLEVFVLSADRDGVDQITEILESRTDIASVHIVSHSEDSAVKLGNVWLGESNLDGYAGQLASWQGR